MAEAQYLRANTGIADPALFREDPESSLFAPLPWNTSTNIVKIQTDVPPQSSPTVGSTAVFEIPKNATYATMYHLYYTISAITVAGSTYARLHDFGGVHCVSQIRIMYDSNLLKTIYPEEYMYHYYKELDLEKQAGFENDVAGNRSDGQRGTLAAAAQTFALPILLPNYYNLRNADPIISLAQKTRIEVDFALPGATVQTDVPAAVGSAYSITTAYLRTTYVATTGIERSYIQDMAKDPDGINYLQNDFVYQRRIVLPAGQGTPTAFTTTVSNIRSPVAVFTFIMRPTVYVDPNSGNPDPWLLTQEDWAVSSAGGTGAGTLVSGAAKPTGGVLLNWQVTSSNNKITPVIERLWGTNTLHTKYFPSIPAPDMNTWSYSQAPTCYNASFGSINYAQLNEPILNITLVTALSQNYYVDAWGVTKNFIQVQGGSKLRTFIS